MLKNNIGLTDYQKIAINFAYRYPITRFMDERHVDYSTACVRDGVDINVCLVGFGKINQQIFLTSVATNQFITQGKDGVQHKAVSYHIFDKAAKQQKQKLDNTYYRYANVRSSADEKEYLPRPELPAYEQFYTVDACETEFINTLYRVVRKSDRDVNLAIISLGSDELNVEIARNLVEKRREWGIKNLVIFVHVHNRRQISQIVAENCFVFDDTPDEYVITKLYDMAKLRNELYAIERQISCGEALDAAGSLAIKAQANADWLKLDEARRDSGICACLSLRTKLNLMGLDCCSARNVDNDLNGTKAGERRALSEEQYHARYAVNDPIVYKASSEVLGKSIVSYSLNFPESLRKNFAIIEHYRWNACAISKGMIPSSREQIVNEVVVVNGATTHTNGKNYDELRHGNLTTFDGLVEYRKLIAKRDNVSELDTDVIKYDYQLMDDAYWLLTRNGFKIVERT